MADVETDGAEETEVDEFYLEHYRSHVAAFAAHLKGKDSSQEPLAPSFVPPTGYWTSEDKDAFYHALRVHSRLRPDLIAEEIKTKTVVDVCTYIAFLEAQSAQMDTVCREELEFAMEVSERLISYENPRASAVFLDEASSISKLAEGRRAQELVEEKDRIQGLDDLADDEKDRQYNTWQLNKASQWKKEDLLMSLNPASLRTLDRLFRSDEQPPSPASSSPLVEPLSRLHSPGALTPRARRKLQNRLYMRRKRAAAKGAIAIENPAKLRVGRRRLLRPPRKSRPKKYGPSTETRNSMHQAVDIPMNGDSDESNSSSDDELPIVDTGTERGRAETNREDEVDDYRTYKDSGKTSYQKFQEAMAETGIDEAYLHDTGLGLFHLAPLSRLLM
jgi:hypothetical protein